VLPPDVNESFLEFAVVPGKRPQIRFGMAAVKNVGTGAVEEILRARQDGGPFASLEDFLSRVSVRIVNRKALDSLIKSGAFDRYNDRSTLLANLDVMTAFAQKLAKQNLSGQTDLFGTHEGGPTTIASLSLQAPAVKYNDREQLLWERDRVVIVRGKLSAKDREGNLKEDLKLIADDAREVTHDQATAYQGTGKKRSTPKAKLSVKTVAAAAETDHATRVYIRLLESDNHDLLLSLKRVIDERVGENEVVLVLGSENTKQIVRLPSRIPCDDDFLERLRNVVGAQNVRLQSNAT
jgi:DNA polymerase III alpha subunit